MNTEKAIKEINSRIELANRYYGVFPIEYAEALKLAIEALRKQESVKPKVDGEFGLCKTCGYVFDSELISEFCVKHCPNCGQKLDWGDWTED